MKISWKSLGRSLHVLLIAQRKNGQKSLRGGERALRMMGRSGRPKNATADENVKVMHNLVMCERRRDVGSIASELSISFGAVQSILTDILGMPNVSARWVPQMLTEDQKKTQLDIYR